MVGYQNPWRRQRDIRKDYLGNGLMYFFPLILRTPAHRLFGVGFGDCNEGVEIPDKKLDDVRVKM